MSVLPSHENAAEWWMLLFGFGMWAITFGLAGSEMSQICDSLMQPAPAILRARKTLTSWQPMFGDTSAVPMTFEAAGFASGISTTEILRCDARLRLGEGAQRGEERR